ncbi:MAG: hypothetical protein K9J30_10515 [Bacteroidales bacterium]|nr:hypothetical protein [Bacteroidales bacterium]
MKASINFQLFTLIFVLGLVPPLFSQDSGRSFYQASDIIYEKIYLHVDREFYSSHENICFKIYLLSGIDHKPVEGYKNIYVQLVNDSGSVVDERLILLSDGGKICTGPADYSVSKFRMNLWNF